jgi:hypothetical protein
MNKQQLEEEINKLTASEKKIFDSVMLFFPATNRESALDIAWQRGIKFQFNPS